MRAKLQNTIPMQNGASLYVVTPCLFGAHTSRVLGDPARDHVLCSGTASDEAGRLMLLCIAGRLDARLGAHTAVQLDTEIDDKSALAC